MSQGDQSIANQAGAAFRSDLNSELQALVTLSSGAAAPGTTYARQYWADTTNNLLKRRNAANSAWLTVSSLDETFLLSRSSNTILGVSDVGKTISATSTFTQTLTAAATLGDGWFVFYRNDGTGVITLDPNSTEQIDGATTLELYPGESCAIVCNGSVFKTVGRRGMGGVFGGTFTRDISLATGSQAVTGLGFKPRAVFFFATASGQPGATSWGFDTASSAQCIYSDHVTVASTWNASANSILVETAVGSYQTAALSSLDTDGFTLSWTKTGTPTGTATIKYLAMR